MNEDDKIIDMTGKTFHDAASDMQREEENKMNSQRQIIFETLTASQNIIDYWRLLVDQALINSNITINLSIKDVKTIIQAGAYLTQVSDILTKSFNRMVDEYHGVSDEDFGILCKKFNVENVKENNEDRKSTRLNSSH